MVEFVTLKECNDSLYVKVKRFFYRQNGSQKSWDIVEVHDSVSTLLFDEVERNFLLVKQFRPAVFMKNGLGYTYELCAGIVDKEGKSLEEIAAEEVLEECGYKIAPHELTRVTSLYSAVGFAGSRQTLFYAPIQSYKRVHEGGGVAGENIEVITLPLKEAKTFMYDETKAKTPALMFAFLWFFEQHPTLL